MSSILDYFKIGAGVALGIILTSVYWLGIPLLNDYPILKSIPLIGPLAVGHVEVVKADALKGYVLQSELTAAQARAKKLEQDLIIGQQIREQADKEADQLDIDEQKRRAADDKAIAEDTTDGSAVSAADIEWVDRMRARH
jgi:hypothetical protein